MVYVMMGVSVFIGFCFSTGLWLEGTESILYDTGVLLHRQLWGAVLLCTALLAEVGFITDKDSLITAGGSAGFGVWLFACIALAMAGNWYVFFSVSLFHTVFHGYVVLATSLGYIRRAPIV